MEHQISHQRAACARAQHCRGISSLQGDCTKKAAQGMQALRIRPLTLLARPGRFGRCRGAVRPKGSNRAAAVTIQYRLWDIGGVFAQRGHSAGTAPIITVFIPGTPLHTTPLQKSA